MRIFSKQMRIYLECAFGIHEDEFSHVELIDLYREACAPLTRPASDEYFLAFIAGALEFFEEVRAEVERE